MSLLDFDHTTDYHLPSTLCQDLIQNNVEKIFTSFLDSHWPELVLKVDIGIIFVFLDAFLSLVIFIFHNKVESKELACENTCFFD